jgi:hypothetical protein
MLESEIELTQQNNHMSLQQVLSARECTVIPIKITPDAVNLKVTSKGTNDEHNTTSLIKLQPVRNGLQSILFNKEKQGTSKWELVVACGGLYRNEMLTERRGVAQPVNEKENKSLGEHTEPWREKQ